MVHTKETLKHIKRAEKKYPEGTKFKDIYDGRKKHTSESTGIFGFTENNSICIIIKKQYFGGMVYSARKKKWADIVR